MGLVIVMLAAFLIAVTAMVALAYFVLSEQGSISVFHEDTAPATV
jgi:hypothetical protein